jgi:DNA-binding transcriptional LysR family regulator
MRAAVPFCWCMPPYAAVAEFERDLLIERTQSGIIRAKAAGKQFGRPPAGVGVVQLPAVKARDQLAAGSLVRLVPDWAPRREIIHAVFPSRRGLLPSVRALIDFLAQRFEVLHED